MLEDIMTVELVPAKALSVCHMDEDDEDDEDGMSLQRKEGGIGHRVGHDSHIKHQAGKRGIEVQCGTQAINHHIPGDISTVVREKSMVGQGI